ncbi:S28 family serine protease [Plebeiibacterium sediminum]|uniref:S28 family serine protease n=1 Tax=Plebeiibacterium sediminum TaxID=2992112 RepID=A0AAE3M6R4_9BACT|nr:S28 family serine protease [Plebeiobacterium sediminum]MCW3788321.1 S28 family serine protease [Plebeiobacterium sediminum]
MNKSLILTLLICISGFVNAQSSILEELRSNPRLQVEKIETFPGYDESFLIMMNQPIDHENPELGSFNQRIWLNHLNKKAPVVMVTEGYSAPRNYQTEIAKELKANQLIVEHRYFLESTPENKDWRYLTVKNAAADHHEIIELFKDIYKGKWLTTGISKGGQTTLFHRAFYPNDVDVSVPYVAPINFYKEDPRLLDFFDHVGTKEDREKVHQFQVLVLEKKKELLPLFITYCNEQNLYFSMGFEKAYEMAVLEYPFAFWQWGNPVSEIPEESDSNAEIMEHFIKGASPSYFADQVMKQYESFFYQAYRELGYYNYVPGDLKPLMNVIKQDTVSNHIFAPVGDTLIYNRNTMLYVSERLHKKNPRMVLICGEYDPWGSTSLDVTGMSHSLKVVKPKGSHRARINNLSEAKKEEVWALIKKWMKVD